MLYRLGEVLRDVEDQELWRASGQPSYALWLEEEAGVARGTAHRAVNVVRNFSEDLAARYGFDKLYQGLRYLELTRAVEQPGDIVALDLRVRGASGRFERVPFHTATVRDILDAIELLQRRARGLPDGLDHAVEDAVTRLVAELPPPPTGIRAASFGSEGGAVATGCCETRTETSSESMGVSSQGGGWRIYPKQAPRAVPREDASELHPAVVQEHFDEMIAALQAMRDALRTEEGVAGTEG